jgi:hypothetical protein
MNRKQKKQLKAVAKTLIVARKLFASFMPEELQKEFMAKTFIGGGAIYSLYNEEDAKDYDFFCEDEVLVKKIRNYFEGITSLKYKNGINIGRYQGERLIITDNAISIGKYQLITRFIGTPEEVIREFDFKHNMFYLHKKEVETLSKWEYLEERVLRYNEKRARDICGTIIRVKKFVERDFTISNNEMAKMLLKLHEVGFNERELEILNSFDERNSFGS